MGVLDETDPTGVARLSPSMASKPMTGRSMRKLDLHGIFVGRRARATALTVEIFGWSVAILGVIAGLFLAAQSEISGDGTSYPYAGYGIGVAVASIVHGVTLSMFGAYVQWRVTPTSSAAD
jgi:hypothetical protein